MKSVFICLMAIAGMTLSSCRDKKLPYIGEPDVVQKMVEGKEIKETIYPTIPDFSFQNQNNETVTGNSFDGKIYVADFFFTTCPTICPVMKKNMLLVYEEYKDNPQVGILSHTIDPGHDSVAVLKKYANDLGINGTTWQFVTGDREKIYDIGEKHYLVSSRQDPDEPGGFIHSGHFVLVDKNKHIRGMYDGTVKEDALRLIKDMRILLEE